MRIEITLPDDTRPELVEQIRAAAARLSADPESVAEFGADEGFDPDSFFTPDVLAEIDQGVSELDKGEGLSLEDVKAMTAARRSRWGPAA